MPRLSARSAVAVAAGGSAALLLGAFAFQYIGGLAPCELCLLQRWPHAAAILIGVAAVLLPARLWPFLGMLAALTASGLGLYHTGVERGWWQGPTACTGSGPGLGGLSGSDLLSTTAVPKLVMCDQVAWQMLGLSMASWNAVISFALALLWAYAATRPAKS